MEHIYQKIDGWFDFNILYKKVVDLVDENSHFVEIGAWKGKSTSFLAVEILKSRKNIKFDVVDTWKGSNEHQVHGEELYLDFLKNIEPVRHIINPIRKDSITASNFYQNDSLDFVFIDASHDYESVKADINAWYPKIKNGGVIAGHDYHPDWPEVKLAVDEFFKNSYFYVVCNCWVHRK